MTLKSLILMMAISIGTWALVTQSAQAGPRLALHATQAEVGIWKQRRTSGPYLDEWNRILSRANNFKSKPSGTWLGSQLNVAWDGHAVTESEQPPNTYPDGGAGKDRTIGDGLRDAAFVYLLTGDKTYLNPVRTVLLQQAAIPGTNFSNTTKWSSTYATEDRDFAIAIWLRKLVYAYSYIRPSLSSGDRTTLDTWFNGAGTYWANVLHNSAKTRFPNRLVDNYSTVTFSCVKPVGGSSPVTHYGGHAVDQFGFPWDNKRMNFAAAVAAIGATTGNQTLIDRAKRYFKEWLRSNIFPDGTSWEQARWKPDNPQSGYNYAMSVIGSATTIADHVARTGDTELYTYSTTTGHCGSQGGPKSLLKVLQRYANITLGNVIIYASTAATTDPNLRLDASGPGGTLYNDVILAQPNVFYQDALLLKSYMRPMPSSWNSGGVDGFGGDWGHLPAARFMFGQVEGKVWPYPPPGQPSLLVPTNLRIISSAQ